MNLNAVGIDLTKLSQGSLEVHSPIDGRLIARLPEAKQSDCEQAIARAHEAFLVWRNVPPPRRGELIRLFGEAVRAHKQELAHLITLEAGKIHSEALGEVQEVIDICDFAVGLSRQLYGLTIASERPLHHMIERWHPLGVCAAITAFNFPMAVFAWNAALGLVCGDPVIWKPSEKTPLTALGLSHVFHSVVSQFKEAPTGLVQCLIGRADVGKVLTQDPRVALVSATGSTRMGRQVAVTVAERFGRTILELGGNNAMIISESADEDLAVRAITFAAAGTAGQRCTTLRRLLVHPSRYDSLVARLKKIYASLVVGDPTDAKTLVGPLIDKASFDAMQSALKEAAQAGGSVHYGERVSVKGKEEGYYVRPALVEMPAPAPVTQKETFAPILYIFKVASFDAAIQANNAVAQGLSSSLMTVNLKEAERFLSASGSDCGVANVNLGPSGAEIGGAFGGEKETGGGRESGSDSWKGYMRRQTQTINYSDALALAQGVQFDV